MLTNVDALVSAEDVRKLKNRVAALEAESTINAARTSRLISDSNHINTNVDSGGVGHTDNTLHHGGQGRGSDSKTQVAGTGRSSGGNGIDIGTGSSSGGATGAIGTSGVSGSGRTSSAGTGTSSSSSTGFGTGVSGGYIDVASLQGTIQKMMITEIESQAFRGTAHTVYSILTILAT